MTNWKPMRGYEGLYEIAEDGQVRSVPRKVFISSTNSYRNIPGKTLKLIEGNCGYLVFSTSVGGVTVQHRLHQEVAKAFIANDNPDLIVCHKDGNKKNNRADNLRWGTHSDNISDQVTHGVHRNSSKQSCIRGHELTGDNVYPSAEEKHGARHCRACNLARIEVRRYGGNVDQIADEKYNLIVSGLLPIGGVLV